MSALGDYVHLHATNYEQYGTLRKNKEGQSNSYTNEYDYIGWIKKRTLGMKPVSEASLNILRARLKNNTSQEMSKEEKELAKDFKVDMDTIYSQIAGVINRVSALHTYYDISKGMGQKIKGGVIVEGSQNGANFSTGMSWEELKTIKNKKMNEFKTINKKITELNNKGQASADEINKLIQMYENYSNSNYSGDRSLSGLGDIQKAMNKARVKGITQQIAGKFGESIVAACGDTAKNLSGRALVDYLSSAIQGSNASRLSFDKDLLAEKLPPGYFAEEDGAKYYIGTSFDKVDVSINIENENILASVKNYSLEADGKMRNPRLQNVNLFQALLYMNTQIENYGNHWLNMHVLHSDKNLSGFSGDSVLQAEIYYEALAGGSPLKSGADVANTFVYINRSNGFVFVKSTPELLLNQNNFASKSIGSILLQNRIVAANKKNGKNVTEVAITNRIQSILVQLHQMNISVALSRSALTS